MTARKLVSPQCNVFCFVFAGYQQQQQQQCFCTQQICTRRLGSKAVIEAFSRPDSHWLKQQPLLINLHHLAHGCELRHVIAYNVGAFIVADAEE